MIRLVEKFTYSVRMDALGEVYSLRETTANNDYS